LLFLTLLSSNNRAAHASGSKFPLFRFSLFGFWSAIL